MRIEISETLGKQLKRLAKNEKKTEQACVEEVLEQFFLDEESENKAYDIALARLKKGGPTVSLEQLRAQFDLSKDH